MITKRNSVLAAVLCTLAWCQTGLAQVAPAAILEVDLANYVLYDYDFQDYTKMATDAAKVAPLPMRTFGRHITLADIVAVNSQPAKGTCVFRNQMLSLRPSPTAGQSIADINRTMMDDFTCEFLQADSTPIGAIMAYGLFGGSPVPGAPVASTRDNYAIIGGTGAFLGARGQVGFVRSTAPRRDASVYEDPANRRTHGGGAQRIVVHLVPMTWPEVVPTILGPAVLHASDFSLVTTAKPARSGEILALIVTGLGPTKPGVDPGTPFPASPPHLANSPVEVTIGGTPCQVLYAGGYPGAVSVYQVNFRLPEGLAPGIATLRVSAGWIAGPTVQIGIQ